MARRLCWRSPTGWRSCAGWSASLPKPKQILIVSAHWESAPVTVGATTPVELTYDFYGFPAHYYAMRYDSPGSARAGLEGRGAHAGRRAGAPGAELVAWTTAPSCR